ncbi:hypothetical protein IJ380_02040 [Candidatus Saccharibacteria bacterium]|nr:hypothetical protein [Candidatus Saccharibacteria bacterium]
MVCIAAFIILGLVGIFVAIISLFKPVIGKAYWKIFKKSLGCVSKKVRLQKCDTNFKDDVKNALFKRLVLKHPTWLKPLSTVLEVVSVIFVFVFVWAVLTSIKSLLALWTLGTCNVDRPAACTLGAEVCSLGDEDEEKTFLEKTGRWFTEWGDIFEAIPDRVKSWHAEDYFVEPTTFVDLSILDEEKAPLEEDKPFALDIVDPGCLVCMASYKNQLSSGFFESHQVSILLYPIETSEGNYKFPASGLISRYFYASALFDDGEIPENRKAFDLKIINRIFTEKTEKGIIYQSYINSLSEEEIEEELKSWLRDFGAEKEEIKELETLAHSEEVENLISSAKNLAENEVHVKGIPTLVYDNGKHLGLYEE